MGITTRSFNAMLNEYITNDLMSESLIKRDWMLQNVEKDNGWKGGALPVPFYGASASSIKMGGLTAQGDVSKAKYVRGSVTGYKEAWGTLRFEHGDILDHDGKVNEKSFLKILPTQVDEFGDAFKEQMSKMLLSGSTACTITALVAGGAGSAIGNVVIDRVDRVVLDQKFQILTATAALPNVPVQTDVYVVAIDLNTNVIKLSNSRGGGDFNLVAGAINTAIGTTIVYDGVLVAGVSTNGFSHLRGMLLSATNGGSSSLYGQLKVAFPYLQAINIASSTVGGIAPAAQVTALTAKNKIFEAYNLIRQKARGNANTVLMGFKYMGLLMAGLEDQKGAFKVTAKDEKASLFGWTEIVITSVKGTLKCVAIQEMDDDILILLDMSALKYYSNGEIVRKRVAPDGKQYHEVREETGYFYLLDMAALGELILHAPTKCGIVFGITY